MCSQPVRPANLSSVMVGPDPTIHKPLRNMDPRLKAEDDIEDMARFAENTGRPVTSPSRFRQMTTCDPSSTTRLVGRRK